MPPNRHVISRCLPNFGDVMWLRGIHNFPQQSLIILALVVLPKIDSKLPGTDLA